MIRIKSGVRTAFTAAVLASFGFINTALADNSPVSTTTGTGQQLNVQIDAPVDGSIASPGSLSVAGKTSIGPLTVNAAVLYVIDVSGSTASPTNQDCNGDTQHNAGDNFNSNSVNGETIDCEIAGIQALNTSLANTAGVNAGVISFSTNATQLDVNPAVTGTQTFVLAGAPGSGTPYINAALHGLTANGNTNYDAALKLVNSAFAARSTSEQHVAFFLSDGQPTSGDFTTNAASPLQAAVNAHTVINTYSVGGDGAGCSDGTGGHALSPLYTIAHATGGTCTPASDPASLSALLANSTPAGISGVALSVGSGASVPATLDSLGNFAGMVTIGAGSNVINATTTASDGTTLTASVNVTSCNSTPNAFGFGPKTAAEGGVLVNSDPITVSGLVCPGTTVPITVTGGSYSINGASFTSNPGNAKQGDVIVAQVTSSTDPHGTATATVTIGGVASNPSFVVTTNSADLSLSKSASATSVNLNDSVTYTITVANSNGPDAATNVKVTDVLPSTLSYVSATPSSGSCAYDGPTTTVTCAIPSIAHGAAATITVVAAANSVGTVVNSASVTAGTPDPSAGNNSGSSGPVSVNGIADLALTKTASATSVNVNDKVTYTITVKNNGPYAASNVTVTDSLPAGLTYVSASTPGGTCSNAGSAVTCSISSIGYPGTATVTVVATANSAGTVVNSASVKSTTYDPAPGNNSGSSSPVTVNKRTAKIAVDAVVGTRVSILSLSINLKPRATLTDAVTGAPVVGKPITFSANNALLIGTTALCSATTDSNGVASCSANILATTLPGVLSFGYTGAFAGDTAYNAVSGKGSLLNVIISP